MIRGDMRTLLRKRLNEDTEDNWTDQELNRLLDIGLQQVQKEILKVDPQKFLYTWVADIVANQVYYQKPAGIWVELAIAKLSDGRYVPMDYRDWDDAFEAVGTTEASTTRYSIEGDYYMLSPAPTVSITNGLKVVGIPTLVMATDNSVPKVNVGLHMAIVAWSQLLALGETGDPEDKVKDNLKELLGDIPLYYRGAGGGANLPVRVQGIKGRY